MHALRAVALALLLTVPTVGVAIPSITVTPALVPAGSTGVAIDLFFNVFPGDSVTAGSAALVATGGTTFESSTNFAVAGAATVGGINRSAGPAEAEWGFGPLLPGSPLAVGAHQFATLTVNAGSEFDDIVLQTGLFVQTPFCDGPVSNDGATLVDIELASDVDGDGFGDLADNCPTVPNPGQEDTDGNRVGDACNGSEDRDGDEWSDALDNCPTVPNPGQEDTDGNGVGDACNGSEDRDGDEWSDALDNCPNDFNPSQLDRDEDGLGDVCDPFPGDPDNDLRQCLLDLARCLSTDPPQDADGDGEPNATDLCPGTPANNAVDTAGCSLEQFCGRITFERKVGRAMATCNALDWKNDEPLGHPMDCQVRMLRGSIRICEPRRVCSSGRNPRCP